MKINSALLALVLGLSLAACATTSSTTIMTAPKHGPFEVACVNPSTFNAFKYSGFYRTHFEGPTVLTLTSTDNVVYYNIPEGTACKIQTENNNNNE